MIIVEDSTETLAPMHRLRWCDDRGGPQKLVCEALMIAFGVVVPHEVGDRVLKRGLSEEDHFGSNTRTLSSAQSVRRTHSNSVTAAGVE